MKKIKEAITDSAIANGYDGDTPKTIAQAVGAFAGVAGGGSGGGGSNVVVVPYEENELGARITLGMTFGEITEALQAGKTVVLDFTESKVTNGVHYITSVFYGNGQYEVSTAGFLDSMFYTNDGPDGYPSGYFGD